MVDIVSTTVRSRMMSAIRGKDTKPELVIRRSLHARGYRYRLHVRNLSGCPDLVLPKFHCVLFVHGCFWHGHTCNLFRLPATRTDFWKTKIGGNRERDAANEEILLRKGWRVGKIWECALKGPGRLGIDEVISRCEYWFRNTTPELEICGL